MFRHKLKELWLAKMAVDPIFKPGLDSEETKRQALDFCKDYQKKMRINQTEWDIGNKIWSISSSELFQLMVNYFKTPCTRNMGKLPENIAGTEKKQDLG